MDQNQNSNTMNNNPEAGERTFTQEDVNRILGERLSKEKAKADAAFAEREQQFAQREKELANREALFELKDKLKEMGLPAELLPVLNVQDKEALKTALEALKSYGHNQINDKGYKVLENRLRTGSHDTNDGITTKLRKAMNLE
jgi:hypothetical protein